MLDDMVRKVTNRIAREGLAGETTEMMTGLLSTLLSLDNYDRVNVTGVQTLLLLLEDYDLPSVLKRLVSELRCRVIRLALGEHWMHGVAINDYNLYGMNKHLLTREEAVTVYEDGFIERQNRYALNSGYEKDGAIFNDYAALLFGDVKHA